MKNLLASSVLLLAACAGHPPPTDNLANAIAATRGAKEAGAPAVPRAALQLKLAEEQIAQARAMMDAGDNERADFMTLRAYNDAELAIALAREADARKRSQQAATEATSETNR